MMNVRKYRWSKHYESAEEELVELLARKHVDTERQVAEEHQTWGPNMSTTDKQIWCVEGSVVYTINSQRYSLQAGDALDIPAHAEYEATAGISGCVWYER